MNVPTHDENEKYVKGEKLAIPLWLQPGPT